MNHTMPLWALQSVDCLTPKFEGKIKIKKSSRWNANWLNKKKNKSEHRINKIAITEQLVLSPNGACTRRPSPSVGVGVSTVFKKGTDDPQRCL